VLIGYLGATKRINSLEANNTVDQEEFDRMMENRDEIQEQMTQLRLILKNIESLTQADNKEGVLKLIKSVDINK
jgi:wobble nucleotide-excising tRNase